MEKFKNKYRIKSARLTAWDYRSNASYFITIITKQREHLFGEIQNGVMCLNEIGTMAHQEWFRSPIIRPDMNIRLGAFVVMPNHIHGVIYIGPNKYNKIQDRIQGNKFGPQRKNIASIIRGYKSAVTTRARKLAMAFAWQARFHDHIIHDEKSFDRIQKYIRENPSNWEKDRFQNYKHHGRSEVESLAIDRWEFDDGYP